MMHRFMNTAEFVAHAYLSECWTCEIDLMCFFAFKNQCIVHRTRRRLSVCDGLYVIRVRRRSTPLVITPFWAAVGHRRTEPGGYFLLKTDTNRYS